MNFFWTLLAILLTIEVFSVLPQRPRESGLQPKATVALRAGILHVHSQFSEHGSNLRDIARDAKAAGIDFVVVTDHSSSQARAAGLEKNYDGVDVFVEMEAATPAGECLTFYSQTAARALSDDNVNTLSWKHFLGTETNPDLFLVVAHPSDVRKPWNRLDRFPEGYELVNFNSAWQRELTDSTLEFLTTAMIAPFNNFLGALRFAQVYPKDFLAWDAMNAVSPGHFAVLGQDNHTNLELSPGLSLPWLSPLSTFRIGENVLFVNEPLPTDFEERKRELYRTIQQGHSAIVFQAIYPFRGNDWRMECGSEIYRSGDHATLASGGCDLVVQTPAGFPYPKIVRIWKDGEKFAENSLGDSPIRVPVRAPGFYRAEVWVAPKSAFHWLMNREVPYILYNPIYVK